VIGLERVEIRVSPGSSQSYVHSYSWIMVSVDYKSQALLTYGEYVEVIVCYLLKRAVCLDDYIVLSTIVENLKVLFVIVRMKLNLE
jgi:hypothetical protein